MREHNVLCRTVVLFPNVSADCRVGKMSVAPHESLLQSPGIRPDAQHFKIMIRFENQYVRAAQALRDVIRHISNIGQLCQFCATTLETERNRFCCVMRNAEWEYFDIADYEWSSRRYRDEFRAVQLVFIGVKRVNRSPG